MSKIPLSVVVPALDAADTIGVCLAAARAAMPLGGELIVVDDGSSDDTAALAEAAGARVIRHAQNRGTSASRNTGWRAARAEWVLFLDADVEVAPDTFRLLIAALAADPEAMGVNALLDLDIPVEGVVSAFANTSIHYQHLRHGRRVATAFTSTCLMRRATLEAMGGWDERWFSRYADDVVTRFLLPEDALRMEPAATVRHHKPVSLGGLVKHRFNVGWFFVASSLANREALRRDPRQAVLHLRFPLNTLAGAGYLAGLVALPLSRTVGLGLLGGAAATTVAANARFLTFTLRHRGPVEAAAALPLCALEGVGCAAGVGVGAVQLAVRRLRGRTLPFAPDQAGSAA